MIPRTLAPAGSLTGDLLEGESRARDLFPTSAYELPEPSRKGHGSFLPPEAFSTSGTGAQERLERILQGDGVFVTTGQQPLLFLGPLYVVYKLVSAVEVARRLEAATGKPALALFWVASDDHDWREVGLTQIIDTDNTLREIRLEPPPGWDARAVGSAPLPSEISHLVDQVFQYLPTTEFTPFYLNLLRDTYTPGSTVSKAFTLSLEGVLGEVPFASLDSANPLVKRGAVPLLSQALQRHTEFEHALEEGARQVQAAGYTAPIHLQKGAALVFGDTATGRKRIKLAGNTATLGDEVIPREVLLRELQANPARFSPNVALRPVLESSLLPVGATVLGPGEIAYWAQLGRLFDLADVAFPRVCPRLSWVLVEPKVAKVLDKLGIGPEDLADGGEAMVEDRVREARPTSIKAALEELRGALGQRFSDVETAVAEDLPGIRSAVGKAKSRVFHVVGELEKQVNTEIRKRHEVLLEQIHRSAFHLHPGGEPQERAISPLYFLARYGEAFVEQLIRRCREAPMALWPEP